MPTMITSECINCGNCVRECPNEAIYKEQMPFELDGVTYPARSEDVHYIVTEKCTDCVGFFFERQCAMVCPVDCCVPDPDAVADDAALLAKARYLHPERELPDDAPSLYRAEGSAEAGA